MPITIPSSALRFMSDDELNKLLDAAFDAGPEVVERYLAVIDARLREFEHRYDVATSDLGSALERGILRDTADVSNWLFWAEVRRDLGREARALTEVWVE